MSINVNTASVLELIQIPGVGEKIAPRIVELRSSYGYVTKEVLHLALRGKMTSEVLAMLDFSEPKPASRNLMDFEGWSMHEDLNAMAAALPSCPVRLNSIPVSTSTGLSVSNTQSSWINTTAPIMSSWANPPYSKVSWPGLLTQTKPMVRHYSPVKFEDDQGQRSCTGSSRTSSCSPVRTRKSIGKEESSDHEYGKLGKSSSRSAEQYPTPSSRKHRDSEQSDAGGPRKRTTGSECKNTAGGRSYRSPSPSRSHSSRDSRESKSHRKGTTGSASKTTAGGRLYRSPSHSRSRSQEDRRGSSRNRKRTTGSARKSTAGGWSSRSPAFRRSRSQEDRREFLRTRKRTTGSRKRTPAGGRSLRSPSSSGSQSPEDKRRSSRSIRKSKTYSDKEHRKSPTRDGSKDNGRTYSSPLLSSKNRSTVTPRTNGRQSRSQKVKVHRSSSSSDSDGSVIPRRCPSVHMKSKRNTRRAHPRRSSSSDSESRSRSHKERGYSHKRSSRRQGDPRKHPKALRYDGKTSWLSFKRKFESFQRVMNWSEDECKDYLLWSLEGKALDFFTITTTENERYSFRRLMKSLESRFGTKELRETSKAKFRQAVQGHEESLEDWADRVLTLATPAFTDLPEDHMRLEAISRFCQGCNDREAAKHACLENPLSMEEALDLVKQHQYISLAVDGKKNRRGREDVSVNVVQASSEAKTEELIASALKEFAKKMNITPPSAVVRETQPGWKPQRWVPSAGVKETQPGGKPQRWGPCFHCGRMGHRKRDCIQFQELLKKKDISPNV
ncbi:hypothetical protein DPMN_086769 [Dreissena polymorpha]|uniref:CCHC-type domain-containing protein n=1 Tax=Dreissena polymorpha TaxID=45954 RepID=A0A9D4KSY4_DREPO|nr:hypothetical protein DPMN_086769 [Dreissena polymorpha]